MVSKSPPSTKTGYQVSFSPEGLSPQPALGKLNVLDATGEEVKEIGLAVSGVGFWDATGALVVELATGLGFGTTEA
jgi:hypothetical protein